MCIRSIHHFPCGRSPYHNVLSLQLRIMSSSSAEQISAQLAALRNLLEHPHESADQIRARFAELRNLLELPPQHESPPGPLCIPKEEMAMLLEELEKGSLSYSKSLASSAQSSEKRALGAVECEPAKRSCGTRRSLRHQNSAAPEE